MGNMKTFADRLKHALAYRDMSQAELARRVGLKAQAIQYLCKKGSGSRKSYEIAQALRVSVDWLTTGKGPMMRGAEAQPISDRTPAPLDAQVITHILDAIDKQRASHGYDPVKDRLPNSETASRIAELYPEMIAGRNEDDRTRVMSLISRKLASPADADSQEDKWGNRREHDDS
ncbi:MAG: hypothetical protein PF501_18960 [Salinisphaera sp.]|jgi:transcriptional regulator with XRE-family HTH domain|nr:hypothetical protein [Salinisphaera sp.]